ncbi:hypothetical protein [Vibrio europaeus]|uniref:Chemotaxis protein n=1 Tax=Vibrio europaeus TaxID=300876 RepID=A0A178JC90_9VIBR|nr:hypothetical protein [Vibrio europaeus]MDC5702959.1 hypothetical protein [Vibrio europaeus]MDC5708809.1 hypothetical protein [Vibrio europaeus]MDC5712851.1 hypothetical protein [Vibrio europaeus]MDC5725271.1 hypothetical protein [Vibrio europaeus]MDC5731865.1 hypothetical protein [Vibrio europaeus]
MGGGGSSSSANTTETTNTNGTSAVSGDNLGVMISGVNGNIGSVTMTDHGSTKAAENIAKEAIASNTEAMKQAGNLGSEALKANEKAIEHSLNFGEKSLDAVSQTNSEAIDAVKALAAQSSENTRTALKVAEMAKTHEQTGTAPQMTKVALGVSGALAVGMVALAWSKK